MRKQTNGGLIFALGLISLLGLGFLTGVPAWLMGNNAIAEIRSERASNHEEGVIVAGRMIGIIGTVLSLLGLIVGVLLILAFRGLLHRIETMSSGSAL